MTELRPDAGGWFDVLDRLLEQMVAQQEAKVLTLARQIVPGVTSEDLRNPQDFAALMRDSDFNFEDGLLAGLRSAQMAIRAELRPSNNPSPQRDCP